MQYSRALLFIHPIYNSFHLLTPNSQSSPTFLLCLFIFHFIYLTALGLCCSMQYLVSWPGIDSRHPVLGAQNPIHWTTRGVPHFLALIKSLFPWGHPSFSEALWIRAFLSYPVSEEALWSCCFSWLFLDWFLCHLLKSIALWGSDPLTQSPWLCHHSSPPHLPCLSSLQYFGTWLSFHVSTPRPTVIVLQEGRPLLGPKSGLLSNTRKWIVRGDTCADKGRDFIGAREESKRVGQPRRTALPCDLQHRVLWWWD